jgi:hypothetical protein
MFDELITIINYINDNGADEDVVKDLKSELNKALKTCEINPEEW